MRSILLLHFCPISDFFHGLQCNTEAKTLAKHFPACFFDAPYHSIKFRPDWSTLNFFYYKGAPFASFFVFEQQGESTLQNQFPAYFFDAPHQSCKFGGLSTVLRAKNLDLASEVAAFFFDHSERNKVQAHFKITTQLIFLMVPTSPASLVQIGALWIFFIPRVPPLDNFSFLVAQTPTRCKQTSKSLPSLFFWWSPPVLQVSSRLEHFNFFLSQGSPLWIIFPNFDKMQKSCIFCFSRYGPHFLTQYSGLPQEQF